MQTLTVLQEKAFRYILSRIEDSQTPPTLRELGAFMGYKSVGSVQDLVGALRKKGYLQASKEKKSRSLLPVEVGGVGTYSNSNYAQNLSSRVFEIPILGSVPAGLPAEALEERVGSLFFPRSLEKKSGVKAEKLYALETVGASMEGAGIHDGDWLICHQQELASHSDIVVAIFGDEVTCKRLLSDPHRGWFLKAENPAFSDRYADEQPFEIMAKVLAVHRILI